jgi:DNA repair exonuclease SbcCD ATPase subunit
MQLLLKKIRWKNFLSTGNTFIEIDLTNAKTTLIVGKNGSGKTTLLDAISYVNFGKPFRKIKKAQLVNSITNSDCLVEEEFEINGHQFFVRRGLKPDVFEIFKNGSLLTQTIDNRDYQNAYEKYIIKINHKTFCQIVMLGSAIFTPFMAMGSNDRRGVIEDLLDLEIFTKMNTLLSVKMKDCDKNLEERNTAKKITDNKLQITQEHMEKLKESRDTIIQNQQTKIDSINNSIQTFQDHIKEAQKKIVEINVDEKEYKGFQTKLKQLSDLLTQLTQRNQIINKEILFLTNNQVCPTCHQDIAEEFKNKALDEKKQKSKEIDNALPTIKMKITSIDDKLKEIANKQLEISQQKTNIQMLMHDIKSLQTSKSELLMEIEGLKNEETSFEFSKLDDIRNELKAIKTDLAGLSDDRTIIGYAVALLKDSGIKAKIIKTFIPIINQLIQKYLAELDFFVEFYLDEEFDETIKSRYRDEFSYNSFSQGEKLRLDVALMFAWRGIAKLRSSININLIIFDEVLDSSADLEGTESIINLINKMTDSNVIIISHRDQLFDKFERVIKFEKSKNFSQIVD